MRQRLPVHISSNDSKYTGSDIDNGVEIDTDLINVNKSANNNNENDKNEA
jgi:hypothetical protein